MIESNGLPVAAEFIERHRAIFFMSHVEMEPAMKPFRQSSSMCMAAAALGTLLSGGILFAQPDLKDTFDHHDTRVFKAAACTKDHRPMEALYYIVASQSDLATGKPSPSAQLMEDEVENNWRQVTSRLTMEQVMEERFSDTYHALLNELVPQLQQTVEQKTGVSISVSEVNSRPMDQAKDNDVPACASQ